MVYEPNPFASLIVSYTPGDGAGFGQDSFAKYRSWSSVGWWRAGRIVGCVVLGSARKIILSFDVTIVDGDGPDLIVFESFIGWYETGVVSASEDGGDMVQLAM